MTNPVIFDVDGVLVDSYRAHPTEPLHEVIAGHPDATDSDVPYRMVEEYPWFGQLH